MNPNKAEAEKIAERLLKESMAMEVFAHHPASINRAVTRITQALLDFREKDVRATNEQARKVAGEQESDCPCAHATKPCNRNCPCGNPAMSGVCGMCVRRADDKRESADEILKQAMRIMHKFSTDICPVCLRQRITALKNKN